MPDPALPDLTPVGAVAIASRLGKMAAYRKQGIL